MNKKTIYILLVFILIIFAGVLALKNKQAIFQIISKNKTVSDNSLQMSITPLYESDNFFRISADYPQFQGVAPAFNEKIANLIKGEIEDFKKNSKENWEAIKATMPPGENSSENPEQPFEFIALWAPIQLNNQYISIVINIYYFSGGAHGNEEIYAFNYDLAKQQEITISDFLGSPEALAKIAELSAQNIAIDLESKGVLVDENISQMIKEGTAPTPENFKDFNFNRDALTIYFQKYQVAPGAAGSIKDTFYKDTLKENSIEPSYLK